MEVVWRDSGALEQVRIFSSVQEELMDLTRPSSIDEELRVYQLEAFLGERDSVTVPLRYASLYRRMLSFDSAQSWIQIEREREFGGYRLLWTSHKTKHLITSGPAYGIEFDKNGSLRSMSESAVTMWLIYHRDLGFRPDNRDDAERMARKIVRALAERGKKTN